MNPVPVNYEALLWPGSYTESALRRAKPDTMIGPLYGPAMSRKLVEDAVVDPGLRFAADQKTPQLPPADASLPLTIVVTTRNDDHVERMHDRTQAFIDCLLLLATRHQTRLEIIIVEWNPPESAPFMAEGFNYPADHPFVSIRIVTVPDEIHRRYVCANALPLYQMIAKNAGIRRARGQFILATNIDVLLSDELFREITRPDLQGGAVYRSNRWDIDRSVLDLESPAAMIDQARDLCFQVNYRDGLWSRGERGAEHLQSQGDFIGMLPNLHTMACGDFQMLHRDDWARLTGYSELDAYSFHIDSLFAMTCYYAGLAEVCLSDHYPHFHIDHTLGTAVQSDTYVINEKKALKHLSMGSLINLSLLMKRQKSFLIFNDDNWGLAADPLPEVTVTPAAWDRNLGHPLKQEGREAAIPSSLVSLEDVAIDLGDLAKRWVDDCCRLYADCIRDHFSDRQIIVWGAGARGRAFAESLWRHGIDVAAFVHGGASEAPDGLDVPVIKPASLELDGKKLVLVASLFADAIVEEIEKKGGREGIDFLLLP